MTVALLAEGVDRNSRKKFISPQPQRSPSSRRAWIEITKPQQQNQPKPSPSSRRAWIEMSWSQGSSDSASVALLAEGVDRNGYQEAWAEYRMKSPSSRRAWIEIFD